MKGRRKREMNNKSNEYFNMIKVKVDKKEMHQPIVHYVTHKKYLGKATTNNFVCKEKCARKRWGDDSNQLLLCLMKRSI